MCTWIEEKRGRQAGTGRAGKTGGSLTGRVIQERDTTGNRQTTEVKGKAGGRKSQEDRRTEWRRKQEP